MSTTLHCAADALGARAVDELLGALEAAGIPAERVRQNQRDAFFDSAENQAAGLVARYPHPVYGMFEQPGALWAFGDLDVRLDRAPPTVGQHSVEILEEVGFTREDDRPPRGRRRRQDLTIRSLPASRDTRLAAVRSLASNSLRSSPRGLSRERS